MFQIADETAEELITSSQTLKEAEYSNAKEQERIRKSWIPFGLMLDKIKENKLTDYDLFNSVKTEKMKLRGGETHCETSEVVFSYGDLFITKSRDSYYSEISYKISRLMHKKKCLYEDLCQFRFRDEPTSYLDEETGERIRSRITQVYGLKYDEKHLHLFENLFQELVQTYLERLNKKSYNIEVHTESLKLIYPKFEVNHVSS